MGNKKLYEIAEYGNIKNAIKFFIGFKIDKDRMILDVGTNLGSFPGQLYSLGYTNVYGIDIREEPITAGRQTYPALVDNLSVYDGLKLPFQDESLDVVTMFDLIEHIPKPQPFLLEVNRVLKKDGYIIFQTPNIFINSIWSTLVWRSLAWKNEHCSLQSLPSLKKLLSGTGFHRICIDKYSIDTEFNRHTVKENIGLLGIILLKQADKLPLILYPNFYGSAIKT